MCFFSCSKDDDKLVPISNTYTLEHEGLPDPNLPNDNPLTTNGIELGRKLFYDTILSSDNTISCASCHVQANAFSDTNQFSIGVGGQTGT
jgi:cytochrome c peroxidase